MKNTLLIIYIVVSSGSIWLLNDSLREAEENIDTIGEILQRHQSTLGLHESAFKIILESIRGLYT